MCQSARDGAFVLGCVLHQPWPPWRRERDRFLARSLAALAGAAAVVSLSRVLVCSLFLLGSCGSPSLLVWFDRAVGLVVGCSLVILFLRVLFWRVRVTKVWAVVMPPCHGKTYRHGWGCLKEADVLCGPKSDPLLVRLKRMAKADPGLMVHYVDEWAGRLAAAARCGDVVMVPDVDVAESAGFEVAGVFVLDVDSWAANLSSRPASKVAQYRVCYDSVLGSGEPVQVCWGNAALTRAIAECVSRCV